MTESKMSELAKKNLMALKKRSYDINFELTNTKYSPIENIGTGAYGVVCSAQHKDTKEKVAIKKIPRIFDHRKLAQRTYREIKILKHFQHDNIICIREILKPTEPVSSFRDVYIVLDLMESDLHRIIRSDQPLTDEHVRYFVYQILRGLKYIHSANVIHRDLKPSNLLVNENCDLKIGDFGMARGISCNPSESSMLLMTQYVATRWYRAPEMMLNVDYTAAIDMWSVGCIFAELLDRRPIFPGKDSAHQLNLIIQKLGTPSQDVLSSSTFEPVKGMIKELGYREPPALKDLFPKATKKAVDMLKKLLCFEPKQRITAEDALKHLYVSKYHDEDDEPICVPAFNFDFEKKLNIMDAGELKQAIIDEISHYDTPKSSPLLSELNLTPVPKEPARQVPASGGYEVQGIMGTLTPVKPTQSTTGFQSLLSQLSKRTSNNKKNDVDDQIVPDVDNNEKNTTASINASVNGTIQMISLLNNMPKVCSVEETQQNTNADLFKKPGPLVTQINKVKQDQLLAPKIASAVSDVEMLSARSVDIKHEQGSSVDMPSANHEVADKGSDHTINSITMLSANIEDNKVEVKEIDKVEQESNDVDQITETSDTVNIPTDQDQTVDRKEALKAALLRRKERLASMDKNKAKVVILFRPADKALKAGGELAKPKVTAYQRQKEREEKRKKKMEKASERKKKGKKNEKKNNSNLILSEEDRSLLARWSNMQQPTKQKTEAGKVTGKPNTGSVQEGGGNKTQTTTVMKSLLHPNQSVIYNSQISCASGVSGQLITQNQSNGSVPVRTVRPGRENEIPATTVLGQPVNQPVNQAATTSISSLFNVNQKLVGGSTSSAVVSVPPFPTAYLNAAPASNTASVSLSPTHTVQPENDVSKRRSFNESPFRSISPRQVAPATNRHTWHSSMFAGASSTFPSSANVHTSPTHLSPENVPMSSSQSFSSQLLMSTSTPSMVAQASVNLVQQDEYSNSGQQHLISSTSSHRHGDLNQNAGLGHENATILPFNTYLSKTTSPSEMLIDSNSMSNDFSLFANDQDGLTLDDGPWQPSYDTKRLPTYSEAVGLTPPQGTTQNLPTQINSLSGYVDQNKQSPASNMTGFTAPATVSSILPNSDMLPGMGVQGGCDTIVPHRDYDKQEPKEQQRKYANEPPVPPINVQKDRNLDLIALLTKQLSKSQVDDPPTLAMTPKGTGEGYGVGMDFDSFLKEAQAASESQGASKLDSPLSATLIADWQDLKGNLDPKDIEEVLKELWQKGELNQVTGLSQEESHNGNPAL